MSRGLRMSRAAPLGRGSWLLGAAIADRALRADGDVASLVGQAAPGSTCRRPRRGDGAARVPAGMAPTDGRARERSRGALRCRTALPRLRAGAAEEAERLAAFFDAPRAGNAGDDALIEDPEAQDRQAPLQAGPRDLLPFFQCAAAATAVQGMR